MKRTTIPFVTLLICTFLLAVSCKQESAQELVTPDRSIDSLRFSPALKDATEQFIKEMKRYKRDSINIVGYLQVLEASENKTFKVHYDGVYMAEQFRDMKVDDYFYQDGIWFCVNYNLSSLVKTSHTDYKQIILEKSGIRNFEPVDTRYPSWLVLISNGRVEKMNKFTSSTFGNNEIIRKEPGWEDYEINEWGEVIDEKGNVIDTMEGR